MIPNALSLARRYHWLFFNRSYSKAIAQLHV
jgi:hypothetical protein